MRITMGALSGEPVRGSNGGEPRKIAVFRGFVFLARVSGTYTATRVLHTDQREDMAHLIKRGSTYYIRRRIPKHLTPL